MQKKFLVNVTAIATAFTMVAAPSITAFATEPTDTSSEAPSTTAETTSTTAEAATTSEPATPAEPAATTQYSADPTNVVNSDIKISDGTTAVSATAAGTSITVNGNIEQKGDHESSSSSGQKAVSTTVVADNGATVTINGNIVGEKEVVQAFDGSTVTVNGNINAVGYKSIHSQYDQDGKLVGTYETRDSYGVTGTNDSNVTVSGKIDSWSTSVNFSMTDVPGGSITVGDTITSVNGYGLYLINDMIAGETLSVTYLNEEQALRALPTITVYEVNAPSKSTPIAVAVQSSQNTFLNIQDDLEAAINYIIKKEEGITYADSSEISLADDTHKYDTIKQGGTFKVNATVNPGYYLDAGQNVQVTNNGDGTYTLLFKNDQDKSKGGIYVRALLIPRPATEDDSEPEYTVVVQDTTPVVTSTNPIANGAIVVSNTTSAANTSSAIAAISGTKPARTVSYNIATVTPAQYKASVIENVAAAPAGGAFNIETDRVSCFDRNMIEAIASRPDIDVNVVFTYGGKKLKVTIPAGYNVRSLLDEGGYCGFLRLMALLGATELS